MKLERRWRTKDLDRREAAAGGDHPAGAPEGPWRGVLEGLASAFFRIDETREIVAPGAFRRELADFLASGFIGGTNHNWDHPIGRPLVAEERREGLFLRAALCDTPHAREVLELLRTGVIRHLSIGFQVLEQRPLTSAAEVEAWWRSVGYLPGEEERRRAAGGIRLLTRVRLLEVSPVLVPANRGAVISAVGPWADEPEPLTQHDSGAALRRELRRWESLRVRWREVGWREEGRARD